MIRIRMWKKLHQGQGEKEACTVPQVLEPSTNRLPDEMNFEEVLDRLVDLSPKAQATFCFRLSRKLPAKVAKTLKYYVDQRLEDESHIGR